MDLAVLVLPVHVPHRRAKAKQAAVCRLELLRVLTFLQRTTGAATIRARPDVPVTAEGISGALDSAARPVGRQIVQLEICASSDGSTVWFARVGRHEHGYLVMLFAEAAAR